MIRPQALIGMVHVGALPGTPRAAAAIGELAANATREARTLAESGFDGVIVENMHDAPYVNGGHGPEITAAMTRVVLAVREAVPRLVLGVQILSAGHAEALAVAHACGATFIRVENFVYAHVADEGLMAEAAAGKLLRYQRMIGAGGVRIFADIKKKHASHAITEDISLADAAHAAEFFGADGVIVTGKFTGAPTSVEDVAEAKSAVGEKLPVWVGSGAQVDQLPTLLASADAIIVGSAIKINGDWRNAVDPDRCREFVRSAERSRGTAPRTPRGRGAGAGKARTKRA